VEGRLSALGGVTVRYKYRHIPCLAVEVRNPSALDLLEGLGDVERAYLDMEGHGALLESLPFIRAPEAHELGFDGEGTIVAVLDSGVDTDHPSLADAVIHQYHFLDQGQDTGPGAEDDHGHGTNVTGIILSRGGVAPRGVAPAAHLVAIKVLDEDNSGWLSDWAAGVDHVISLRDQDILVDAINMSLVSKSTFEGICDDEVATFSRVCKSAVEQGIAVFASSGNNGLTGFMTIPACYSSVVAVGSVYDTLPDRISGFTNRSPFLDLLAPGQAITSTGYGGGTSTFTGTSQAAPHAVGVACLLRQIDGTISPAAVREVLMRTGRPFGDPESLLVFPIIDARSAVEGLLVPRVSQLNCGISEAKIQASWAPASGIEHYHVSVTSGDHVFHEEEVAAEGVGFLWLPPAPGGYQVSVRPYDLEGLQGLEETCSVNFSPAFSRGDCSVDGNMDISDPIRLIYFLFLSGSAISCAEACDSNDDNSLDISDGIYSLNFLFLGGTAPPLPFGACGPDPTGGNLGCQRSGCP
jgi:hypothetical protein